MLGVRPHSADRYAGGRALEQPSRHITRNEHGGGGLRLIRPEIPGRAPGSWRALADIRRMARRNTLALMRLCFRKACAAGFFNEFSVQLQKSETLLTIPLIGTIFFSGQHRHEGRSRDRHRAWCGLRWAAAASGVFQPGETFAAVGGPGAATLALRRR
jgi:hypothetical protein